MKNTETAALAILKLILVGLAYWVIYHFHGSAWCATAFAINVMVHNQLETNRRVQ